LSIQFDVSSSCFYLGEYPISSCKDFGSSIYYFLQPTSAGIRGVRGYSPYQINRKACFDSRSRPGWDDVFLGDQDKKIYEIQSWLEGVIFLPHFGHQVCVL
jgi:hypothetical protein